MPSDLLAVLEMYELLRGEVCRSQLHTTDAEGKKMLISVLCGGSPPSTHVGNEFVAKLQKVSIYLRWLAISLLPSEYSYFLSKQSGKKPDSSLLSHLYMACEDAVLQCWAEFLVQKLPRHLSLHFDGVRVSAEDGVSSEELCKSAQECVMDRLGFDLTIREKKHLTFLELVRANALRTEPPHFPEEHVLTHAGNCIPHAIGCLQELTDSALHKLTNPELPANTYFEVAAHISNAQACSAYFFLLMRFQLVGKFLLHLENGKSLYQTQMRLSRCGMSVYQGTSSHIRKHSSLGLNGTLACGRRA